MTSLKQIIPVYLAVLACCLAVMSLKQSNLESRALRLDLKVMTMELTGQRRTIARMGVLRNQTRAKADILQYSVVLLAVAFALASPALISGVFGAWFLIGASIVSALSSGWLAGAALL